MTSTLNLQAIVLGQEDWREHDALITLYTRELGKLEAVAKGLRKRESKLAAHLEPLTVTEVFLVNGRGLPIVAGSIPQYRFPRNLDVGQVLVAGSIARLANRMTPLEGPDERVYDLLVDTLAAAAEPSIGDQTALLPSIFAWKLLAFSGYRPELKKCLRCQKRSIESAVELHAARGGAVHRACLGPDRATSLPVSAATIKGLSYMVEAPIEDTLRLRATDGVFAEITQAIDALVKERFEFSMVL